MENVPLLVISKSFFGGVNRDKLSGFFLFGSFLVRRGVGFIVVLLKLMSAGNYGINNSDWWDIFTILFIST
jgi:hypothetical protein